MGMKRSSDAWDSLQVASGSALCCLVPQKGRARGRHSAMDGRPIGGLGRPKPGILARISN
jgi:hypothetical protein